MAQKKYLSLERLVEYDGLIKEEISEGDAAVKSYVDGELAKKANSSHTHDDRYYTESEIDTKLNNVAYIDTTDNETIPDVDIPSSGVGAKIDVVASVGQTIVVEEVDADGKPTKWKAADYQPRTHWSESADTVLVDNQSIGESDEVFFEFILVPGQSYHIVFNGVEYDEVARPFDMDGMAVVVLGNTGIYGFEDTGEPYLIMSMEGMGTIPTSSDGDYTLTLSTTEETVHKLPAKYIPDEVAAYAPYYITVFEGDNGNGGKAYFTVVSVAQLEALIDAGRMVIAKMVSTNFGTYYLRFCNDHTTADGKRRIGFSGGEVLLQLVPQDDGSYICESGVIS